MVFLFNDSIDTTSITNVLLIDKDTHDYEIFYNSCNGTTFPIVYSRRSSRNDLLQLLNNKFSNINRLCFVFSLQLGYVFLNNEFLFRHDETSPYSENVTFIINLINQFNISTVDYLACDTLNYEHWQNYYNIILSNTTAIVGASNDRTGNLKYGGDWMMESTGLDIQTIYFSSQIQNYQQLLDGAESNYVIMNNGTVYACGFNDRDMLGIGTSSGSGLHLMINNTGKTPSAISVGRYHAIILMTDGTIYGLGENTYGQLGTGSTSFSSPLVQMVNTTGKTPVSVSCGVRFTIVLMSDGTIYGCGQNTDNQLGPGWPGDDILTLQLMPNNTGKIPVMVEAAGGIGVTILMTDGTIYSTGRNSTVSGNSESVGRYGNGTTTSVVGLNQMINNTGKTPVSISSSGGHTMVLMDDGTVYGTGYNLYGQLLNGNTTSQTTLVQMINTTGKTPVGIATGPDSTFILMSDHTVYSAGFNNQGQLGTPVNLSTISPFGEVGNTTGKTIRAISVAESFTTFLMTDGTVYGVGAGYGIYTTSSPSSVSSLSIPMTIPTGLTPIALPDQRVYGSLSNFSIPTKTYIDSDFTITQPTTTSSGSLSYSSSNTSVATVSGNTITIVGIGTTTITASQARTATHTPATTTTTFQVDKITPSINNFSLPTRRYGTSPFIITTPTSTSNGTFSYVSSDESVATVSGNIITIVGAGTATITSTQAETEFYKSETVTSTIQVSKAIPSISSFSIPTKNYEDSTFTITPPTSNSSGSFSYVSSDESVATISGDTVTIVGVGTANIIATQTETSEFTPGSIISSFQVGKAVLSISDFSIPTKTYGDSPFTITPPTSDSNGSFNYISADPSVATISGNTITIVGAGTANILAIQTKTSGYTSGTITASFRVSKAIPTIGNFSIQTRTVGDSPFTITQPTSNSNGTFTYISTDTSVATISGNTVTVVGAGSSVIIAIQGKTTNYSSGVAFTNLQILSPA
jgi:alpha-tubulin suppressor-like RCC1 family protein